MPHLHESPDGRLIEYRRAPSPPFMCRIEGRVLRPDGMEYDDRWWPTSDAERLNLDLQDTGILAAIAAESIPS